ncbi:MAG: MEMO1 family protein [Candidatus Omnitrophota bacterium]
MIRNAFVAGRFYTADREALEKEILGYAREGRKAVNVLGCVSPHAGYVFSGEVAGNVLSAIEPKKTYVILGPNHTGMGMQYGLDLDREWATPLGKVRVDRELGEAILDFSKYVDKDTLSHNYEHSIEVQLPFLQVYTGEFSFVPIMIGGGGAAEYKAIGAEIAEAIRAVKCDAVIIASSDMSHHEPQAAARKKDSLAIEKIIALDIDGFLNRVAEYDISMCGCGPAAIMMAACINEGAAKAELIRYMTSGEASGDYSSVVGYAGIIVY